MGTSGRLVAALLFAAAFPGPPPAAADVRRHVTALASDVGPRPTGGEAERRAIEYVRAAFAGAGLLTAVEPVEVVLEPGGERRASSANVIGRLAGESAETIVVAAHHDTRGGSVPGANDDASGVAVLIETARRVAGRPRRLSYLFASFTGEEEGLLGSRLLASTVDPPRIRAMATLELVGRGQLLVGPVPGPPAPWAQRALLRAGRAAGPGAVAARPLWTLAPRFLELPYGADHEPFLERGIPALLIAGTYPAWLYHTPADTADTVSPAALERAVAVLDRLLLDWEEAAPVPVADAHDLPLSAFGRGVLIPSRALRGLALAALAWTAAVALWNLRSLLDRRRVVLALRALIVAVAAVMPGVVGLFAGEAILERWHGAAHPWMAHHGLHLALAAAGALAGGWIGLVLFRRIKPAAEPGPYGAAALALPAAGAAAALASGWPEIAFFAAAPLLAFLASRLTGRVGLKFLLGVLGAVPLALLLTPADYRALVELGGVAPAGPLLSAGVAVAALPFVLHIAYAAAFRDCLHSRLWWRLAGLRVGGALFLAWAGLLAAAAALPPYDDAHRQVVRARHAIDLDARRASARIESLDSLRGVVLPGGSAAPAARSWEIERPYPDGAFLFEAEASRPGGDPRAVACSVRLRLPSGADRVTYTFASRAGLSVPGRDGPPRPSYAFTLLAPPAASAETFTLLLPEDGDLELAVRAESSDDLLGLRPAGRARVFVHRAVVTGRRVLLPAPAAR